MDTAQKKPMPEWQKAPEELPRRFAELVQVLPGAEVRKMFGYPSAFYQGQMFAGVFQDRMFVRLPEEERAELLKLEGATPFEPMAGRPMREYVVLPQALIEEPGGASTWLERAVTYAASLPPKEAKPKRKGGR